MAQASHCLTGTNTGLCNVLISLCEVSQAFDPKIAQSHPPATGFNALWDTGATNSVITQKVVDACGLVPISMTQVNGVHGPEVAEVYLISLKLPNQVDFSQLRVTKGKFIGADVLIGMDIINRGDFAVTNHNGITTFSYRFPSQERIDFCEDAQNLRVAQQMRAQNAPHKQHRKRPKKPKRFGRNKH
jgi:hypothetical protein